MASLKELPLADFELEVATTKRVLERVPPDQFSWKPHAKSRTLGELATHLADVLGMQIAVLTADELDLATSPPPDSAAGSREALLDAFDANLAGVRAAIAAVDESALTRDWTLRYGDHVVFTLPKLVAFRTLGLSHIAHHRGQLTVYLRLLDVPVPSVYGPTADEQ